jgi:hypothetical protein
MMYRVVMKHIKREEVGKDDNSEAVIKTRFISNKTIQPKRCLGHANSNANH